MNNSLQDRNHALSIFFLSLVSLNIVSFCPHASAISCSEAEATVVTENRKAANFDKVEIDGGATLSIIVGKPYSLQVKGPQEDLQDLDSYIDGDTLVIAQESTSSSEEVQTSQSISITAGKIIIEKQIKCEGTCTICLDDKCNTCSGSDCEILLDQSEQKTCKSKQIEVTLTLPTLSKLEINGAINANVQGVHGSSLELGVAGSGHLTVSGQVETLKIDLSGTIQVDTTSLSAHKVNANVSGAAQLNVAAQDVLNVDVSGTSQIGYKGNPRVHKEISGAGRIKKLQ